MAVAALSKVSFQGQFIQMAASMCVHRMYLKCILTDFYDFTVLMSCYMDLDTSLLLCLFENVVKITNKRYTAILMITLSYFLEIT